MSISVFAMARPAACFNVHNDLSHNKIIELFQAEKEQITVCHLPPVKPRAGDVYVYSPLSEVESG